MKDINFLPERFITERKRRQRVAREVALIAVIIALMVVWYVSSRSDLQEIERFAIQRELQAQAVRQQVSEMAKLREQQRELTHQVRIQRELAQPLKVSEVIGTIGHLTPESVVMTQLGIEKVVPNPPKPSARSLRGSANRDKQAAAPKPKPAYLQIRIEGFAPDDSHIAEFVGGLSRHALFTNVKMLSSQTKRLDDVLAREFRLEVRILLDRQYRAIEPRPEEATADAS